MSNKKHIDRLFQEGLKDFEATPNDTVWENIEAKLNQKKKKRRIIPIWWRYAGIAALLLLLLTIGNSYFNTSEDELENHVVNTDKVLPTNQKDDSTDTSKDGLNNFNNPKTTISDSENAINPVSENNIEETKNTHKNLNASKQSQVAGTNASNNKNKSENKIQKLLNNPKSDGSKDAINLENNSAVAKNSERKNKEAITQPESLVESEKVKNIISNASKNTSTIAEVKPEDSKTKENNLTIEEVLDKEHDKIEKEKPSNKWRIAPNAAPVYFSSLGEGSSIDPQFNNNSKTGEVNMSYGISASYAINNKISIRSGVNKVNLGYNTNNVVVFQSVGFSSSSRSLQNVNANNSSDVSIISGENLNASPGAIETSNTSINQSLGYIEVPLEIQYALSNKKLGVNVIGGFSSFFLSDNKVFSEPDTGGRTFLGEASNINNVSYSANFGLGINYQVSKKIDLNLEPMFKYQINTFNNTSGDFTPYFIGVYTGFAIKF